MASGADEPDRLAAAPAAWLPRPDRPAAPQHLAHLGALLARSAAMSSGRARPGCSPGHGKEPGRWLARSGIPGGSPPWGRRSRRAAVKRRRRACRRIAIIVAAKGGTLGDITIGDCLELLDADDVHDAPARQRRFYQLLRAMGSSPAARGAPAADRGSSGPSS